MLELIAILGGVVLLFYLPSQTKKVCNGWVSPKFKGEPATFRTMHFKQLTYYMWTGVGLGAGNLLLALIDDTLPGEWIFKLLAAAIWFGVAVIGYHLRVKFGQQQPA
jgi:hypothetical protein